MVKVESIVFNPYQENTYIVSDETREAIIIDPGCADLGEQERLRSFVRERELNVVGMVLTHGHFDHLCGSKFVCDTYHLKPVCHSAEVPLVRQAATQGSLFGFDVAPPPEPIHMVAEDDSISFGSNHLKVIHTPGHSPGSISLYSKENHFVIVGDVLFQGSIGRTDLPGGDYEVLMASIHQKLLPLGNEVIVYPGHGPSTDLGHERRFNPFIEKPSW